MLCHGPQWYVLTCGFAVRMEVAMDLSEEFTLRAVGTAMALDTVDIGSILLRRNEQRQRQRPRERRTTRSRSTRRRASASSQRARSQDGPEPPPHGGASAVALWQEAL